MIVGDGHTVITPFRGDIPFRRVAFPFIGGNIVYPQRGIAWRHFTALSSAPEVEFVLLGDEAGSDASGGTERGGRGGHGAICEWVSLVSGVAPRTGVPVKSMM